MKRTKLLRASASVLAFALLCAGCGNNKTVKNEVDVSQSKYGTEYPIESETTLTMWSRYLPDNKYLKIEDQPAFQETLKKTGIRLECSYPSGDPDEAFNLMIASGEYPDMILYRWLGGSYSAQKALEDNVILPLNDIISAWAPNASRLLAEDEERAKYWKTDNGTYFAFPTFSPKNISPWLGPIVRQDLLEKLNIDTPETIDDWTEMLRAFKANGVEAPLTLLGGGLTDVRFAGFIFGAYETAFDFYVDSEGKVQYGPTTPQFKQAVEQMRSWYAEGLLDSEFVSTDDAMISQKMLGNQSGVTDYFLSRLERWKVTAETAGTDYKYAAIPYPVLEKGQKPEFGYMPEAYDASGAQDILCLTTQCKDVELATKMIDWWYTEEGKLLSNFGIEGETYTLEGDEIKLTPTYAENFDLIMPYIKTYTTVTDPRFAQLRYTEQEQKDAQEIWVNNMSSHIMPPVQPTTEESSEQNSYLNDIISYAEESVTKFIVGQDSMDNYDTFVENLKKKGVDKVIAIKQGQLDRFNNR